MIIFKRFPTKVEVKSLPDHVIDPAFDVDPSLSVKESDVSDLSKSFSVEVLCGQFRIAKITLLTTFEITPIIFFQL